MDTILNLGLNDEVVEAFAKKTQNPRFAYDSYRRFIQMYSDVVMESLPIPHPLALAPQRVQAPAAWPWPSAVERTAS